MIIRRQIIVMMIAVSTLLGGCSTVGLDYQGAPQVDYRETWNQQIGQSTQTKDLSEWWSKLNDPILFSLIERANANSLDLRMALSRIDEARAQYGIASSQYYPTIDGSGSAARQEDSENNIMGFPSGVRDNENIGIALQWELDFFGRIRRQAEVAGASFEATVEDYRNVLVVLNAEIANTYIQTRTLQKRLELAHKNTTNQRQTLKVVKARYNAELTSELDVLRAEQNLAASESTIPLLNAALAQSFDRLAVLLGQYPGTLNAELAQVQAIPSVPSEMVVSIPRDILRQRPDIRRAERQLAAQTAQIGVATADLYPRLSLSGAFGFATSTGSLLSSASNFWSFEPGLVWNIFDARRTRENINVENAKAEQARVVYEKTVLAAFSEVETGLINYGEELNRLRYLRKSAEAAEKSVRIAKSQYKNGLTNFQTTLDAERVLFAQEDRLANSEGALIRHLVDIHRAMGGGWPLSSISGE